MSTPKQFAWCVNCSKSFSTKRSFLKHKKECNKDYELFGEIVKVASGLLDARWLSPVAEDHPKCRPGRTIAKLAGKDQERRRLMAIRLREIAESTISRYKKRV